MVLAVLCLISLTMILKEYEHSQPIAGERCTGVRSLSRLGRGDCNPKGALLPQKGGSRAQGSVDGLVEALVPEDEDQTLAETQEGGG